MKTEYYILLVCMDSEPQLIGPLDHELLRDNIARSIKYAISDKCGYYRLDIKNGKPSVSTFIWAELDED